MISKLNIVLAAILSMVCSVALFSQPQNTGQVISADFFPEKTFWLNTDFPLAMETMKEKVLIVAVIDERCVECEYFLDQIRNSIIRNPGFQIVSVMKGDADAPISRSHLVQYVQKHGFEHPIGVLPDMSGFKNAQITAAPYFLIYEKANTPSVHGGGYDGFNNVMGRIKFLIEDQVLLKSCMMHQFRSWMEPSWYANPVIEMPGHFAVEEGGDKLYINDAAHNRLLVMNEEGECEMMLGSMLRGYNDDGIYTSQFNRPHGLVHSNGKLFIADTYNNRIRVADFTTERVTTLTGNGYDGWKKVKTIDSKFEPLGLPVDLAVLGNTLYVASAATNQIFEVDMNDGAARLFCDLPITTTGMLRNCPVNLNAGNGELYLTMADGQAFVIDRKGKFSPIDKKRPFVFTSVLPWKGGVAGITRDGKVVYKADQKEWKVLGQPDSGDKSKNLMKLNYPMDMATRGGDLIIADTDHHMFREVGSPEDKMMKNYWMKPNQILIGFEAAHTGNEVVLMDTIFLSNQDVRMNVILDLEGYKIIKDGQNELVLHDLTGKVKLDSETLSKEEFTISVKSDYPDLDLYLEVYITMEHPENPGLFLIKRAYLDFPVSKVDVAEPQQEQIYKPTLLPN